MMNLLIAWLAELLILSSPNGVLINTGRLQAADTLLPVITGTITYRFDTLNGKNPGAAYAKKYTETELNTILAINRVSPSLLRKGRVLVMPDTLLPDPLAYSPYPYNLPGFDSIPKLVLISRRVQAFALYEYGQQLRWGPVSSGKKSTPTPAGLFHANFRAERKISTENSSWIMPWYTNFYARRGIAMHQYFLPGYPASHACVRMQLWDALFIFNWAELNRFSSRTGAVIKPGTPVILFGDYDFSKKQPWLSLPLDSSVTSIRPEELEEISSYLPVIHTDVLLREARK